MTERVTEFYDRLGPAYRHNMGWDWEAAVREDGTTLDRFISMQLERQDPYSVLDCSCGIGTQAIGLALQGHQVHATDLGTVSVECARQEACNLGVTMSFGVADFRELSATVSDTFDVVLTCDNSMAHCLKDEDLDAALTSMKTQLNPGGLLLLSVRDYDALVVDKARFNNGHVHDMPDGRRVVFQLWDWTSDGRSYRIHQFLIKETDGSYEVKHFETELRALLRHDPQASGYYQPIVTARSR